MSQSAAAASSSQSDPSIDLIKTPVQESAWGEKLADRVLLLAGNSTKTVEIRLTPADLGPLKVRVSIDDGTANITFQAQHALTREAIEQALPRLREMISDAGLSLGQTDVSEQDIAGGNADHGAETTATAEIIDEADEASAAAVDGAATERQKTVTSRSLVDTFA